MFVEKIPIWYTIRNRDPQATEAFITVNLMLQAKEKAMESRDEEAIQTI